MDTREKIRLAAQRHGVPEELALEVATKESRFNQRATSPKGARGVMQLMPGTARDLGVDLNDEDQNIDGGVRYLKQQLDAFGGDPRLAKAAYNAGAGNVRKYGGVPPFAETRAYVDGPGGAKMPTAADLHGYFGTGQGGATPTPQAESGGMPSSADLKAYYGVKAGPPASMPTTIPQRGGAKPVSQTLGMMEGLAHAAERLAPFSPANLIPGFREANEASMARLKPKLAAREQTATPGKAGRFEGDVLSTAWVPGGPVKWAAPFIQGGLSAGILSDATDTKGLAKDVVTGAAFGKAADLGASAIGKAAPKLLSVAPKVMSLPELQQAKKDAYKAVEASGFTFGKKDIGALADDFAKSVASSALSKSAKDDAASIIAYTRSLAKGDVPLAQLEKLHGDIYSAMVKKGGDTGALGMAFRDRINTLIDGSGDDLVRTARNLNGRFKKADVVTRASQSADIRAEKDYGGDFGRKVKDRVFPLIDPANPTRNLRGATADEKAALLKVATGTKTQNLASTVGGMLDPRRLGGKIMAGVTGAGGGAGAVATGGLSLLAPALQMGAGFGLTGVASGIARRNVDDLIRLFVAGGSKQALARVPAPAAKAVQEGVKAVRPALPLATVVLAPRRKASREKR